MLLVYNMFSILIVVSSFDGLRVEMYS